jgi:hypothetical protein
MLPALGVCLALLLFARQAPDLEVGRDNTPRIRAPHVLPSSSVLYRMEYDSAIRQEDVLNFLCAIQKASVSRNPSEGKREMAGGFRRDQTHPGGFRLWVDGIADEGDPERGSSGGIWSMQELDKSVLVVVKKH